MNERLAAMRAAMLGQPAPAPSVSPRGATPSATALIAQLRAALANERKARLAAEARLRSVLVEISRRSVRQPTRAAPPPAVEVCALPAPASEAVVAIEGEVIDGEYGEMSVRDHIAAIGGDDDEGEE